MMHVLAVDGGNTKTLAIVASIDGTIRGYGRSGRGDIYYVPPGEEPSESEPAALKTIAEAIEQALAQAGLPATSLEAGVFNMAGADWPEDFALLTAAMQARGYGRRIVVQNDALGVLHAGVASNVGVAVICGTGAATGARGPDGRSWHSSHWQNQVQGANHLAHKTLNAVYRAELGIEAPTSLRERVLDYFQAPSVEAVLHLLTARLPRQTRPLGGLAAALLDEAQRGDTLASQIVSTHGRALGDYALVAARRVGLEGQAFPIVLAGGVLRHPCPLLAEAIIARVRSHSPEAWPLRPRFEPVIGALFSALELAGQRVDEALIARVAASMPPASFFETLRQPEQPLDGGSPAGL